MSRPSHILVTGGAGFVGSHAAEFYAERGAKVTVYDNMSRVSSLETADETRNTASFNRDYLEENYPEISFIDGDVRNRKRLFDVVEGHDAIVHTAGQVAVTASLNDPHYDFQVNAEGTFNILDAASAAESDPAVVFASTNKVYGDNVNEIPVKEVNSRYWYDSPEYNDGIPESLSIDDCEHTPYGVSKLAGDLYVQDYAARNEVDAAAFRMSCIYGPRQFGNEDQGWVAHFAISAKRDEPITVFGDGKQVRDVLYVTDLIDAYDSFLSDPTNKPAVFNMGGGPENTTSLLELLEILGENHGWEADVTYDEWREGDQKVYVSDISRAKEHLNWKPKVDFNEGVERYAEWLSTIE
ncbi:NAD-dependent epimerase/dehydratase family protein [Halopiger djelfimassiliensis]|uniref:NAD-dependent epimerase/dehydratase family protein n=1 Tax=Halopiger djelfimassiliensis TaxID=1293047 RepID=UPI0009DB9523|nr:NAD-dependent epimerase/dehydratase family protein [Halopiger djelfimassiliensis]